MKIASRILKLLAILIVTIGIILFAAARLMQDRVADVVLLSLNQNVSTKIHVGSFRLSFLSKFPKASLELSNVLVHSSPGFNTVAFVGINTDTLLSARNVSLEFSITDIIRGHYNIDRIRAKTGRLNIFTDTTGMVNYDVTAGIKKTASKEFSMNLDRIYMADFVSYYNNLGTRLIMNGVISKGILRSRIRGNNISFNATGEVRIDRLQLYSFIINKRIITGVDIDLQKTKEGITFKKSNLHIDNFNIGIAGFISSEDFYDLKITGNNIDISGIRSYLPDKYAEMVAAYDPSGTFVFDSKIRGIMTRRLNPHTEVNFHLEKGRINYRQSRLNISNISFSGIYSNGAKNHPATGSVSVKDIRARLGSSDYSGTFSLSGFNDPYAEMALKGKAIPSEIREFFDVQNISEAGGSADFDIKLAGKVNLRGNFKPSDLIDMKSEGNISFNSLSIGFKNNGFLVNDVTGSVLLSGTIQAKDLKMLYKGQRIAVSGEFTNLLQWLEGRHVILDAKADVSFNKLIPQAFLGDKQKQVASGVKKTAFKLPDDLNLDINFRIDSMTYKTFSSSKISGTLNYKPRLLTFKSFNMKALKGSISGNGFILQNYNKSVLSKGIFNVSTVDVNQAFTAFQNFGQTFLKAENIAGSLSGSFSVLLPLDSMLNPQIKNLTAEGKATLLNGGLINFDPVKELSSFIELSELENIHFEKMENDFFIRNNYVYIPTMEVRSSAVDLSVNGKHSLDNDYEYHVKVLLSEILSRKRKKVRTNVTEFGEVQDDGLGRTSMLLKVVYKGEDVKVSYDMKAAAFGVKNSFNSERKNMKTILNQEYGWYKNDSAVMKKQEEKKPRFKVVWDDK